MNGNMHRAKLLHQAFITSMLMYLCIPKKINNDVASTAPWCSSLQPMYIRHVISTANNICQKNTTYYINMPAIHYTLQKNKKIKSSSSGKHHYIYKHPHVCRCNLKKNLLHHKQALKIHLCLVCTWLPSTIWYFLSWLMDQWKYHTDDKAGNAHNLCCFWAQYIMFSKWLIVYLT